MTVAIDPADEFGLTRTECACRECVINCKAMPAMLVPGDLARLIPPDAEPFGWAEEHLRASPGALVGRSDGSRARVPTLVPAHRPGGSCHWLDADDRCEVHAHSPAGCRYFGHEATREEGDRKSLVLIRAVARDIASRDSLYAALWGHLAARGLTTSTPEERRKAVTRLYALELILPTIL